MKLRFIIFLAIAGCAACHRNPGNATTAPAKANLPVQTAASNPHGPNPEQLTAGMVEAVTQGKAQAPLGLKFDLLERPVRGQPLDVAIALLPQTAARSATVVVSASEGLKVDPSELQFEFPAVEAAQVYRHSIKVTPMAEGLALLTLSVSLQHELASDSRAFAVPILVAAGETAAVPPGGPPAATTAQPAAAHRGP